MSTYNHNGRWYVVVQVDPQTVVSRDATDEEIAAMEAAEPDPVSDQSDSEDGAAESEAGSDAPRKRGRPRKNP